MLKRGFDLVIALLLIPVLALPALIIALLVKYDSAGPLLFWSERRGQNLTAFKMPKFRTMHPGAPVVATNKLKDSESWTTNIGKILRKYSLDEIPQLWCVLKGEMSLVGPRPLILGETDVHAKREKLGVHVLRPGMTGWAQINGRDRVDLAKKVALDYEYTLKQSLWFDIKILFKTCLVVISKQETTS